MKKHFIIVIAIYFILSFLIPNISFPQCGKERWNIKTLTDKDTVKIDFDKLIKSTVHDQINMDKPKKIKKGMPRLNTETTVYEIEAYIIEYKEEDDRDFHIVIQDPETDETMVVEIVDPECPDIDKTSRYENFKVLREWFTNEFNPSTKFKEAHNLVKLVGVGFFDFIHGQRGMTKNGRKIHPVLKMEFK